MFRKLILASAVSLAMLPGVSWSLGLGGIRTQSALNEPFSGEIDLYDVKPDELDTVQAVLASPAEFSKVGAERTHFLTRLRFSSQVSATGNTVVRIESREPIREPYLDFLVEVVWPKGRIVKGYTVLLDPPVTLNRSAPRVAPPTVVRRGPRSVSAPAASAAPRDATGYPLRYGPVDSGTGLWRVARAVAPSGATVPQTAMALYRSNQSAFIRGDINKLKLGSELEIPSPDELFALDARAAEREFSRAMRGGRVTATPITDISRARQPADRLEIATAPAPAARQSTQTLPEEAGGTGAEPEFGAIQRELLLVQESAESTRQEAEELRSRVRELETQLTDIKKLLELRNEQLAQLQTVGVAERQESSVAETSDVPPEVAMTQPESAMELGPTMDDRLESGPEMESEPELVSWQESVTEAPEQESQPAQEAEQTPDETLADTGEPADEPSPLASEATPATQKTPEVAEKPVTPQPSEPRTAAPIDVSEPPAAEKPFWAGLSTSTLGMAVGIPALLGLVGFWLLRRRKDKEEDELESAGLIDEDSTLTDDPTAESVQPVSEQSELTVESVDIPSHPSAPASDFGNLDEDTEEADILSEVDVYIAFGRYREAENLLNEEIKTSPERMDLKFKLGEVHQGTNNAQALEDLRSELKMAGAEALYPDQWRQLDRLCEELAGKGSASARGASVVAFPSPAVPAEGEIEATGEMPQALSQDLETSETSEITTEFELSDLIDGEGDSLVSEELPSIMPSGTPDTASSVDGSERAGAETLDVDTRGFDLDESDLEAMGSGFGPSEVKSVQQDGASVFDSHLEELEDFDLHSALEQGDSAIPESHASAFTVESAAAADTSLGSLGEGGLSKDSSAEDIFSSQWEMDSGLWDEVATKIDLARAYMEMEDPDAARLILEEVVAEGNDEQKGEAREMLSRLK